MNFKALLHWLYEWLSTYNLFIPETDVNDDDQEDSVAVVRHQRYTTWLYVLLLLNVTPSIFNELRLKYPTTLSCPCSKTTIPFQTFVSNSFTFHPICSSVFVDQQWIEGLYLINASDFGALDFRTTAHSQFDGHSKFKLLSNLCSYSKDTISQVQNDLNNTELVSVDLMSEENIRNEVDAIVELLRDNVASHIRSSLTYLKIINQANYLITSLNTKAIISYDSSKREIIGQWLINSAISFETGWDTPACIDIVKVPIKNATFLSPIYFSLLSFEPPFLAPITIVNGFFASCTTLEALLPSTLDCLYDINCIELLIEYFPSLSQLLSSICQLANQTIENAITHFINQSFISSSVLNEIDFDIQLNSTLKQLYQSTIIYFRLLTDTALLFLKVDQPYAVIPRKNTENSINFNPNLVESIVTNEMNNETLVEYTTTNNIDRMTANRLGQWATRLYIVLFTIGFAILALYTTIHPRLLTKNFDKPSLNRYNRLVHVYKDQLECPCSRIAPTHNKYVDIQPIFHEICSSPFASDEWRQNVTINLIPDLSLYDLYDYRRFLSAHLQFLSGLCELSTELIQNSVNQFLSSVLVTRRLLSEKDFRTRLHVQIEQSKSNGPTTFSNLFFLIRSLYYGNNLMSTYGTNFQYFKLSESFENVASIRTMIYDNNCSCGLHSNCTSQASFLITNSSHPIEIKGLKIGCTPSESFLASTLECFYDISCINLIQEYTNYTNKVNVTTIPIPLLPTMINQSSINTTIAELHLEGVGVGVHRSFLLRKPKHILKLFTIALWMNTTINASAMSPLEMDIGDMNGDTYLDVVISNWLQNTIIMMHGSEDGTLGAQKNCILSGESIYHTTIAVTDVNGDGHMDVVLGRIRPHGVIVLLGQGNGRFEEQTIFTTAEWNDLPLEITIGDLNNDGCQDIIDSQLFGTFYEHSLCDTITEKFQKFQIDSSLSVSLLSDLAKVSGSFKFLTESSETSQIVTASVFYRETAQFERLKETVINNNEQLNESITFKQQPDDATHIVIGIIYGFCVNATFQRLVEKHEKKNEIQTKLKLLLTEIKPISSGSAGVDIECNQTSKINKNSFSVKIYADFNLGEQLPQTVEETLAFFKKLPDFTKKDLSSAKPIEYILYPINNLKRQLNVPIDDADTRVLSQRILHKIQSNADYLLEKQQEYNDYYEMYSRVSACISNTSCETIREQKEQLIVANVMYREKLGQNLVKVRSSIMEEDEFLKLIDISFDELKRMYKPNYIQKKKIDFLCLALDQECVLSDEHTSEDLIPYKYGQNKQKLFLGVINDHLINSDEESWRAFMKRFLGIMTLCGKEARYVLCNDDLDATKSNSTSSNNFRIMHYYHGKLIETEIIDIKDNLPLQTLYCNRCGGEDNEERFVILRNEYASPIESSDATDRLMNYGKVVVCEPSSFDVVTCLRYSSGVHRLEFQIVSCQGRTLELDINMYRLNNDISHVQIKFGAPLLTDSTCYAAALICGIKK
ncbi:hypothetical protein I4U23_031414 [Adineta vaga]|nr:hypothetical protein I4U23_031414 [Adineta vaga]